MTQPPKLVVCVGCERIMEDEGFALCDACDIHLSDDCPACGSQMPSDRACSCDINSPRADTRWDRT